MQAQLTYQREQINCQPLQMQDLISRMGVQEPQVAISPPTYVLKFTSFNPSAETWKDYLTRLAVFTYAHSVTHARILQMFLTNQPPEVYKFLCPLAAQQSPPK
ncbi:hypothetical protein RF11_08390 [Thelohanellus kitauei]|uniref:Uncharacterized protein n=1 Tax=Thelohanellus kitauei TaxID=669202 RepID=A0A0C2MTP1_THEKT|nr:hypothetical protein RF11_08390 [Thelohanellus kitauei]